MRSFKFKKMDIRKRSPPRGPLRLKRKHLVFLFAVVVVASILCTPDDKREHLIKAMGTSVICIIVPVAILISPKEVSKIKASFLNFLRKILRETLKGEGEKKEEDD